MKRPSAFEYQINDEFPTEKRNMHTLAFAPYTLTHSQLQLYTQGCRWLYATKCANNMSTRTKLAHKKNIEGKYKYIESHTHTQRDAQNGNGNGIAKRKMNEDVSVRATLTLTHWVTRV